MSQWIVQQAELSGVEYQSEHWTQETLHSRGIPKEAELVTVISLPGTQNYPHLLFIFKRKKRFGEYKQEWIRVLAEWWTYYRCSIGIHHASFRDHDRDIILLRCSHCGKIRKTIKEIQ